HHRVPRRHRRVSENEQGVRRVLFHRAAHAIDAAASAERGTQTGLARTLAHAGADFGDRGQIAKSKTCATISCMRAWLMDSYDGVEKLRQGDVPEPSPGPGEVLLGVRF